MSINLYPKLAFQSIRKNKQFYYPFILTCILVISIYYIIASLASSEIINNLLVGDQAVIEMLYFGQLIVLAFSVIFLFYTFSFLIKRRKKEYGLYEILGLSKNNIIVVGFFECLIIAIISLLIGLILGILLSKLFELGFLYLINKEVNYTFSVSIPLIFQTIYSYGLIFLLLYIDLVLQIRFTNMLKLLKSQNLGERPPKGNLIITLIGLISLIIGYYLALTIESPIEAMVYFFEAVLFVIIGVYCLLISGSVFLCRILKKNKRYYYKLTHFINTSFMSFRMKRNGAGLASICILSTMVLVTLSSTICLYVGAQESINSRYPRDINISLEFNSLTGLESSNLNSILETIDNIVHSNNLVESDIERYQIIQCDSFLKGDELIVSKTDFNELTPAEAKDVISLRLVPLEEFNNSNQTRFTLTPNELIFTSNRIKFNYDYLILNNRRFKLISKEDKLGIDQQSSMQLLPTITLVASDYESLAQEIINETNNKLIKPFFIFNFNCSSSEEIQDNITNKLQDTLFNDNFQLTHNIKNSEVDNRIYGETGFYALYGAFLYLGLILSTVFVLATALIIYYKQITEGYEDEENYHIMSQVGLARDEISKTVRSQMRMIFLIPIILAVINLSFAYPLIEKMLTAFNFYNPPIFMLTTLGCVLFFTALYYIIYKLTSYTYLEIVS